MSYKSRSVALDKLLVSPKDIARFWAKVRRGAPNECWPWVASTSGSKDHQYGQFTLTGPDGQIHVGAHVFAFELANGWGTSQGHKVCHSCDNPPCCNAVHLFKGTHSDNMTDAGRKGRLSVPRPRRHKLSSDEIYAIRDRVALGEQMAAIAREKGVTKSHIWQVVNGYARQFDAPLAPRLVRKAS